MTKLVWDKVGERLYETGIDRGVLYLSDGSGIPWNGLTAVEEDFGGDTTTPDYYDGIKYQDSQQIGDFSAKLSAITYPDEFLPYEGVENLANGLFVDSQDFKTFGLSYRTLIGETTDYRIHILYNLTATPESLTYQSVTSSTEPLLFSWNITGVPERVVNYRPTAHVIFDSRFLNADLLAGLEDLLYGGADSGATLPTLIELVDFVSLWGPMRITPQELTGLSNLVAGVGDLTVTSIDGVFTAHPSTRLEPTTLSGFYILGLGAMTISYLGNGVWTANDNNGEYITMTDATTFSITSPSAIFLDADTYEISSHD